MALSHLRSLQALELALRMGSLQAAAHALRITPAAVGQRITALEDYLGVDLLVRTRSGLRPTVELAAALENLAAGFRHLEVGSSILNLQRGDEIRIGATTDFVELWLRPRLDSFRAEHPQVRFCVNGEGETPLRVGPVDCEISFGAKRDDVGENVLFHDFVLPIGSPSTTRRFKGLRTRDRLEGFPLLHLDFYKDDPRAPNWPAWIQATRLRRTAPQRGIRFQRITPAIDAVLANAGFAICGLALLGDIIAAGQLNVPFPASTGTWTEHAFRARFRPGVLNRPQVRAFRGWLVDRATETRLWLEQVAAFKGAVGKRRRISRASSKRESIRKCGVTNAGNAQ